MFDNIGGKIKGLAAFIGIGGLIVFLLAGIIVIAVGGQLVTMLICFGMAVICLVSSWPLYGFGKLVEDIGELKELKSKEIDKTKPKKSIEDVLPNL